MQQCYAHADGTNKSAGDCRGTSANSSCKRVYGQRHMSGGKTYELRTAHSGHEGLGCTERSGNDVVAAANRESAPFTGDQSQ